MKKTFIYMVGTYEFRDTTAFGKAWKEAKAKATEKHCGIFRTTTNGTTEKNEFYANCGAFLNMKFYEESKVAVF